LASTRTNWYWVRLTVVSMLRFLGPAGMNSEIPPTAATFAAGGAGWTSLRGGPFAGSSARASG